jgi:hypothetical protein
MAVRQSIVAGYKRGEPISKLARTFGVSRGSVYSFIKRARCSTPSAEALRPNYSNCGKPRATAQDFVFRAVRCLRNWHPDWGAEKIHAELLRMRPHLELPHYRTFNRWFHWNGQAPTKIRSQLPQSTAGKATELHTCWQVDAKEEMTLADGSRNCWLNIADESSGTVIQPPVFSH